MHQQRLLRGTLLVAALAGSLPGCPWEEFLRALSQGRGGTDSGVVADGGHAVDAGRARDGGQAPDASAPADEARPDPRAPYTPLGDVEFIDFFKPHHRMAIDMADMVLERGEDAEVRRIAERVRDVQTRELDLMRLAREELTGEGEYPPIDDPTGEADMARLASLSGTALDRAFLVHMIPHHGGGLPPAHRALPHLRRADMRALARAIYVDQAEEVGEMYALLERLTGDARAALAAESRAIDPPAVRVPRDPRAPFTPTDDVRFTDMLIPHHRGAVMMAEMELARGADPEVRRMALQMRDAQRREIAVMQDARRALGVAPEPPPIPDPHMERDMAEMRTLSGAALDRMFLAEMIPHHGGGLEPAHRVLPVLRRPELSDLATDVMDTQAREVGEMVAALQRLGGLP